MSKFIKVTEDGKTVWSYSGSTAVGGEFVGFATDSNGKAIVSVVPTVDRSNTCAIVTEESFDDVRRLVTE
jgi:hypothetical protein